MHWWLYEILINAKIAIILTIFKLGFGNFFLSKPYFSFGKIRAIFPS